MPSPSRPPTRLKEGVGRALGAGGHVESGPREETGQAGQRNANLGKHELYTLWKP